MRLTRAAVPALVVVSLGGSAVAGPLAPVSGRSGSVVVASVQERGADGAVFTEGAVVEVRLRDASGAVVDTERGDGALRFDHLGSDTYGRAGAPAVRRELRLPRPARRRVHVAGGGRHDDRPTAGRLPR